MGRRRSKRPDSGAQGCVIVNKPAGCTSHDVVDEARKAFGTRKVGHAGTLDPDATGVLVLGVGRGTKLLQFVTGTDKIYEGDISFGVETSTLDAGGEVTARHDMTVTADQVHQVASQFVGDIEQIPPMVSALKVDGKRLHELAREGKTVERKPRPVTVSVFDTAATADPLVYQATVHCSSGTYIRTLAADVGVALGGGAHLSRLRRLAVGPFTLEQACELDSLQLLPVEEMVRAMPVVEVDETIAAQVRNGRSLGPSGGSGYVAVRAENELLAIYESVDGELRPAKVLTSAGSPAKSQ